MFNNIYKLSCVFLFNSLYSFIVICFKNFVFTNKKEIISNFKMIFRENFFNFFQAKKSQKFLKNKNFFLPQPFYTYKVFEHTILYRIEIRLFAYSNTEVPMPPLVWAKSPVTVLQEYEKRHGPNALDSLIIWATCAVESLYYLDDLDAQTQATYPASVQGHHADIVDIAHVRWATGTAITSLDLCAAALGRHYCRWTQPNELDLRGFVHIKKKNDKQKEEHNKRRSLLPDPALSWVDSVLNNKEYKQIRDLRNPFTHSRLPRHFTRNQVEFVRGATIGGADSHTERTRFTVSKTGKTLGARELVTLARDLATQQVSAFLDVIDNL